jgi:hypothetical protein
VEVSGQLRALATLPREERNPGTLLSRNLEWAPEPVYILEKKKSCVLLKHMLNGKIFQIEVKVSVMNTE